MMATETAQARRTVSGVRGKRYGEVLLVNPAGDGVDADVYNSFMLGDCPAELWDGLDAQAIAREHGVLMAVLNGPRYWLMDSIERAIPATAPRIQSFGGIDMFRAATLHLGPAELDPSPYIERHVTRGVVFAFDAGRTIHELTAPNGHVYVMQALCTAVDPDLTEEALGDLGARIGLPDGWSYSSRVISKPLRIETSDADAAVVQDEFRNTYSRRA
jgi:hypothetical protein